MKTYTGIGSRKTPDSILDIMKRLASRLASEGWTLRSGGANGADSAFESGAILKEIYLPWKGFNNSTSSLYSVCTNALKLAKSLHPAWDKCSNGAKKLHARNTYQVLGKDLNSPSKMLVCYTPNGLEVGGTATAIKLAKENGVEVINLGDTKQLERVLNYIQ